MKYTWNTHEVEPNVVAGFVGSVVRLDIECPPTQFVDNTTTQCTHVHIGKLTGMRVDVNVETIGDNSNRDAQLTFEFEGKQVGIEGVAILTLTELD